MKLGNPWQYEVAAMLSQLGCVTLAPEIIEAVYKGDPLTPEEQAQYTAHPSVAYSLLSRIPRLEPIAWMIEHQNRSVPKEGDPVQADIRKGAELLRLILTYEDAVHKGSSRNEAAHLLVRPNPKLSPEFFAAFSEPRAVGRRGRSAVSPDRRTFTRNDYSAGTPASRDTDYFEGPRSYNYCYFQA